MTNLIQIRVLGDRLIGFLEELIADPELSNGVSKEHDRFIDTAKIILEEVNDTKIQIAENSVSVTKSKEILGEPRLFP